MSGTVGRVRQARTRGLEGIDVKELARNLRLSVPYREPDSRSRGLDRNPYFIDSVQQCVADSDGGGFDMLQRRICEHWPELIQLLQR